MPRDRLALPVGVEVASRMSFAFFASFVIFLMMSRDANRYVFGREVVFRVHAQLAFGQVADVPGGRDDLVFLRSEQF